MGSGAAGAGHSTCRWRPSWTPFTWSPTSKIWVMRNKRVCASGRP